MHVPAAVPMKNADGAVYVVPAAVGKYSTLSVTVVNPDMHLVQSQHAKVFFSPTVTCAKEAEVTLGTAVNSAAVVERIPLTTALAATRIAGTVVIVVFELNRMEATASKAALAETHSKVTVVTVLSAPTRMKATAEIVELPTTMAPAATLLYASAVT